MSISLPAVAEEIILDELSPVAQESEENQPEKAEIDNSVDVLSVEEILTDDVPEETLTQTETEETEEAESEEAEINESEDATEEEQIYEYELEVDELDPYLPAGDTATIEADLICYSEENNWSGEVVESGIEYIWYADDTNMIKIVDVNGVEVDCTGESHISMDRMPCTIFRKNINSNFMSLSAGRYKENGEWVILAQKSMILEEIEEQRETETEATEETEMMEETEETEVTEETETEVTVETEEIEETENTEKQEYNISFENWNEEDTYYLWEGDEKSFYLNTDNLDETCSIQWDIECWDASDEPDLVPENALKKISTTDENGNRIEGVKLSNIGWTNGRFAWKTVWMQASLIVDGTVVDKCSMKVCAKKKEYEYYKPFYKEKILVNDEIEIEKSIGGFVADEEHKNGEEVKCQIFSLNIDEQILQDNQWISVPKGTVVDTTATEDGWNIKGNKPGRIILHCTHESLRPKEEDSAESEWIYYVYANAEFSWYLESDVLNMVPKEEKIVKGYLKYNGEKTQNYRLDVVDFDETFLNVQTAEDGKSILVTTKEKEGTAEIKVNIYSVEADGSFEFISATKLNIDIIPEYYWISAQGLSDERNLDFIEGEIFNVTPVVCRFSTDGQEEISSDKVYYELQYDESELLITNAKGDTIESNSEFPASDVPLTIEPLSDVWGSVSLCIWASVYDEDGHYIDSISRTWELNRINCPISFDSSSKNGKYLWEGAEKELYLNTDDLSEKCSVEWIVRKEDENGEYTSAPQELWEKISKRDEDGRRIEGIRLAANGWSDWAKNEKIVISAAAVVNGKEINYAVIEKWAKKATYHYRKPFDREKTEVGGTITVEKNVMGFISAEDYESEEEYHILSASFEEQILDDDQWVSVSEGTVVEIQENDSEWKLTGKRTGRVILHCTHDSLNSQDSTSLENEWILYVYDDQVYFCWLESDIRVFCGQQKEIGSHFYCGDDSGKCDYYLTLVDFDEEMLEASIAEDGKEIDLTAKQKEGTAQVTVELVHIEEGKKEFVDKEILEVNIVSEYYGLECLELTKRETVNMNAGDVFQINPVVYRYTANGKEEVQGTTDGRYSLTYSFWYDNDVFEITDFEGNKTGNLYDDWVSSENGPFTVKVLPDIYKDEADKFITIDAEIYDTDAEVSYYESGNWCLTSKYYEISFKNVKWWMDYFIVEGREAELYLNTDDLDENCHIEWQIGKGEEEDFCAAPEYLWQQISEKDEDGNLVEGIKLSKNGWHEWAGDEEIVIQASAVVANTVVDKCRITATVKVPNYTYEKPFNGERIRVDEGIEVQKDVQGTMTDEYGEEEDAEYQILSVNLENQVADGGQWKTVPDGTVVEMEETDDGWNLTGKMAGRVIVHYTHTSLDPQDENNLESEWVLYVCELEANLSWDTYGIKLLFNEEKEVRSDFYYGSEECDYYLTLSAFDEELLDASISEDGKGVILNAKQTTGETTVTVNVIMVKDGEERFVDREDLEVNIVSEYYKILPERFSDENSEELKVKLGETIDFSELGLYTMRYSASCPEGERMLDVRYILEYDEENWQPVDGNDLALCRTDDWDSEITVRAEIYYEDEYDEFWEEVAVRKYHFVDGNTHWNFGYSYKVGEGSYDADVTVMMGKPLTLTVDSDYYAEDSLDIEWSVFEGMTGDEVPATCVSWKQGDDGNSLVVTGEIPSPAYAVKGRGIKTATVCAKVYSDGRQIDEISTTLYVAKPTLEFWSEMVNETRMLAGDSSSVYEAEVSAVVVDEEFCTGEVINVTIEKIEISNPDIVKVMTFDGDDLSSGWWFYGTAAGETDIVYTVSNQELWGDDTRQITTHLTVADTLYYLSVVQSGTQYYDMLPDDTVQLNWKLEKRRMELQQGIGYTFYTKVKEKVDPSQYKIMYESMDETMLTVSDTGVISSKGKTGTASIRACAYVNNVLVDTEEYTLNVNEDFVRLEMQGEYTMCADRSITLKPVFKYYSSEYSDGKEIKDCDWEIECNSKSGEEQVDTLVSDGLTMKLNPELSRESVNYCIADDDPIPCTVNAAGYEDGWHYDSVSFYVTVTECEQHTWEETGRTQPTCTDAGVITKSCVRCGAEASETIPALKHVWDKGTVTKKPTCTGKGEKTYHCTRDNCTGTRNEEIAATGHTAVKDAAVEATCENSGLTEGSHCSVCGKVLEVQKEIPAFGHTAVKDAAVEATCENSGLTEGSHCSVCGKVLEVQKEIPAFGHTVVKDAAVEATCENSGLTEGSHCSVCGKVLEVQKEIPAFGHTVVKDATVEATCENSGLTEGSHCSVCGKVLVAQKIRKALGHKWDAGTVTVAATCTEDGVKTYECTRKGCTGQKTEAIAATNHTAISDKAVAPTCTKAGKTEGSHCSVCGKVLVAQKTRKALGHKWGKWTKKSEATVFKAEVQQHTCSRCKKTETKTVGKKLSPILEVSTSSVILKTGQSTKVFCVTKMANGDSVKSWKSSNTAIVKVSGTAKGTCTLAAQKKIGTAKLTVTLKSGKTKTVTVKVQKGAVVTQKITGIPSMLTIQKGKSVTFAPKRNPLTSTDKITFASSNAAVASVTAGGKLTAKAKGTTVITVKAGKAVVKCKVTVK